jgi:hypothetical protein
MKYDTTVRIQFKVAIYDQKYVWLVVFKLITGSRRCMREIQAVLSCGAQATCPFKFREKGRLLPSI